MTTSESEKAQKPGHGEKNVTPTLEEARENAKTLDYLWNIHDADGMYCKEDGFLFPCKTRRVLEGERLDG